MHITLFYSTPRHHITTPSSTIRVAPGNEDDYHSATIHVRADIWERLEAKLEMMIGMEGDITFVPESLKSSEYKEANLSELYPMIYYPTSFGLKTGCVKNVDTIHSI